MKLYSFFDKVTESYGQPFVAKTEMQAKRIYGQVMSNPKVSPSDFDLCLLGDFDLDTGVITPVQFVQSVNVSDIDIKTVSEVDDQLTDSEE